MMPNLPSGVMELARLHIGANYVGQLSSAHNVTAGQIREPARPANYWRYFYFAHHDAALVIESRHLQVTKLAQNNNRDN
jgi:hypothetical protein